MKKRPSSVLNRLYTVILPLFLLVSFFIYGGVRLDTVRAGSTAQRQPVGGRAPSRLARPPLDFVENRGQWDAATKFVARKGSLVASFSQGEIKLQSGKGQPASVGLSFEGASKSATLIGEAKRDGSYNFFTGNDRAKWRANVAAYGSLLYRGVYDGIDVRVRDAGERLEYDLLLAAGADLERVVMRADGASGIEVAGDGSLILQTANGSLRQTPPRTWEVLPNGETRLVECRFRKIDAHRYGFESPARNRDLPLVVDPGLEWATYLGGSEWEEIYDLAAAGNGSEDVIAVGTTASPDFSGRLTVAGFVARYSATGALVYKTILGGSDREWIRGIAVSASGEPVVVGESYSPDYPTTPGAYDTTHGFGADGRPGADAFVTRLNATGDQLVFSTFIGTNEYEQALAVALAPSGEVVVTGETTSPVWPTTTGAFDRTHNCCTPFGAGSFSTVDAWGARLNANGSALEYSTYFGGNGDEMATGIVVDAQGFVTFTGLTYSPPSGPPLPTTPGALTPNPVSGPFNPDAFLVRMKLDGNGTADLRYSTFIGGTFTDEAYAIALDPANPANVVVAGFTNSTVSDVKFPTTAGTLRPASESVDGFVMKFQFPAATGGNLVWSTLFGGFLYEEVSDLCVDAAGNIVIAGRTQSFDLPTTDGAYDRSVAISSGLLFDDAFVARISPDGAQLLYGTYLGGRFDEWNVSLALVGANSAVLSGWTQSADYPATPTAHDTVLNDDGIAGVGVPTDGFLARITLQPDGDGDDTVDAPELLSPASGASVGTNTLLTFDWSDVSDPSGIDGYHIQLNRRPDFVCCNDWVEVWTSTSEHVNSVRFDGPYYWRVQTADRSGNLSEWSEVRTFNSGLAISAFTVNPATVEGGNTLQGQVALSASAPAGGAVVSLSSSNAGVARVPASVTVPTSSNVATFTITTSNVAAPTSVTISGAYRTSAMSATLTVTPGTAPPAAPTLSSPANNFRLPPNQGITFVWNAAGGAVTYEIQVDDSSAFNAPLVVSLAGLTQTQSVHSFSAERTYWWRVRGRNSGGTPGAWSAVRTFQIRRGAPAPPPPPGPVTLSTLTLNPASVTGGNSSQGTVTLSGAAPSGGVSVALSDNSAAANVPASVNVPAGATSATFTVTTSLVTTSTAVTVSASLGGVTRTATLTLNPAQAGDTVAIQRAEYDGGKRELRVEATSTNSSAVLQCYVTSTGALIGTLSNNGGRYSAQFSWPTNPQNITVRSSLGGSATRAVANK